MGVSGEEARKAQEVGRGDQQQVKRAIGASVVGTAIEWYDFFLYGTAAALVFPTVFFPESSSAAGTLESFATFAVGFAARPVGAAIFGHWGDRIGRKATLIATLLTMGIATAIIGLIPSADSIGLWAPVLLVLMRIMQGIGVGGEWSGSILLAMEWGNPKRRGLNASWPQVGVPIGLLLANGAVRLFEHLTGDAWLDWGWRIPFLLSLVLVAIGLYVRLRILETPVFARAIETETTHKAPVLEVIKRNPKEILLSALLRLAEQMPFYLFTVYILSYGVTEVGLSEEFLLNSVLAAAALSLFSIPFFGNLSDKIGRKRVYMTGATLVGLLAIPYFLAINSGVTIFVFLAIFLSLVPHDMMYGPQASLIAESFSTGLRYSGAGLGYQLASVFAGGPAPLVAAALYNSYGTGYAVAAYIIVGAVLTLIATALIPDRSKIDIDDDAAYDAPTSRRAGASA